MTKIFTLLNTNVNIDIKAIMRKIVNWCVDVWYMTLRNAKTVERMIFRVIPIGIFVLEAVALLIIQVEDRAVLKYNIVLYGVMLAVLMILPVNWYVEYVLNGITLFGINYFTEFLIAVRGRPFNYMDIFSAKEAMRVSGNYKLIMNTDIIHRMIYTVIVILICCAIFTLIRKDTDMRKLRKTLTGIEMLILNIVFAINVLPTEVPILVWYEIDYVKTNGQIYATYCEYINTKQKAPENYSKEAVNKIFEEYGQRESTEVTTNETPDDIYVIMNESFADYGMLGETLLANDTLENIHNITKNCFIGKCGVGVYAGNTANSEYEFLTGETTALIPKASVAYMLYDFENHKSIVEDMNDIGYNTKAVHPYLAAEWKREKIYEQLGFTDFISGEDFTDNGVLDAGDIFDMSTYDFGDNLEYVRGFISDNECYKKMTTIANADKNFTFTVTIQNHGGFDKMAYNDARLIDHTGDPATDEYFYSIRESDKAFKELTEKLKDTDRKVVVLMFGDHQSAIDKHCVFEDYDSGQYGANDYIVPYILWANYDVEWDAPEFTSVNYLSAILKKNCNLPLNEFDNFRLNAMEIYPVITANFAVDIDGNILNIESVKNSGIIKDYAMIQYDRYNG